jgi:peptidyl-prolyl cis-trans isomerase C
MKRILSWLALGAVAAGVILSGLACGGCGYDEKKVVVTIDGGKNSILVGDFVYHYKRAVEMAPPQDKPVINTYDDAKDFLDDLITSRVLEMEADRLGYGKDPNLTKDIETYRSGLLRQKTQEKIAAGIKVTEAEILDFYNKNKEWRRVSFIGCDKKAQADKAHAELKAGKPWDLVCKTYSVVPENKDTGGVLPNDFYYSGDSVSNAVYATPVGQTTPVIKAETGDQWFIFRVDKKVPGQKDEYAKVKEKIRASIKESRVRSKLIEATGKLRKEAKITVNQEIYDAVIKGSTDAAGQKYFNKGLAIAEVGGVKIPFDSWYEGFFRQLGMNPKACDEFKAKNPDQFKTVLDEYLKSFEDEALLEYDAVKNRVDKQEDFIREVNKFRASKMVDRLYNEVFLPTIPAITPAEIQSYFDAHKVEYQEPEAADIYILGDVDQAKINGLFAQAKAGKDVAVVAEGFRAALNEMYTKNPPKEPLPEDKMPICEFLQITKNPPAAAPNAAPGSPSEPPILTELRPKVFAAKPGDLVGPFQTKDKRWVMFKYVTFHPMVQHTLTEKPVADDAKIKAYNEKVSSPETDRKCQAWFKSLRAKHKIEINESALKMAFKKVQKL